MIYDFLRKVQDENAAAVAKAVRLDNSQLHSEAAKQRIRAGVLHEVLTWAGFEGQSCRRPW